LAISRLMERCASRDRVTPPKTHSRSRLCPYPPEKTNDLSHAFVSAVLVVVLDRRNENLLTSGKKRHGVDHGTPRLARIFPAHEDIGGGHGLMTFIWKKDRTAS
jgi:hypothetical protein